MHNLWAISDPTLIEQIAPLCRVAPAAADIEVPAEPRKIGKLAVVPVMGPITRYGGFDFWRGERLLSSYSLRLLLERLARDSSVAGTLFVVDSPGGQVSGIVELGDAIKALSAVMPTVALVDGYAASAALFITSTVRQVVATRGSWLGSCGTYAVVTDISRALDRAGIKVHAITSSTIKVSGLFGTELTEEQQRYLRRNVDVMQAEFERTVEAGRRLKPDQMKEITTGALFPAKRAMQLGLCDAIGTLPVALATLDPTGIMQTHPQPQPVAKAQPAAPVRAPYPPALSRYL